MSKAIQRYVYSAFYATDPEISVTPSGTYDTDKVRRLVIIAPHFQRAAFKAVQNTKDGETLVSMIKQPDAVV